MSVVIIIGKNKKAESESAIENVAEPIGGENDADFSNMFLRQGKMFFQEDLPVTSVENKFLVWSAGPRMFPELVIS